MAGCVVPWLCRTSSRQQWRDSRCALPVLEQGVGPSHRERVCGVALNGCVHQLQGLGESYAVGMVVAGKRGARTCPRAAAVLD